MCVYRSLFCNALNDIFQQLFVHNFVHCDLHPGNILVHQTRDDESLVILDCGVAATLSKRDWMIFFDLFNAIAKGEVRSDPLYYVIFMFGCFVYRMKELLIYC